MWAFLLFLFVPGIATVLVIRVTFNFYVGPLLALALFGIVVYKLNYPLWYLLPAILSILMGVWLSKQIHSD